MIAKAAIADGNGNFSIEDALIEANRNLRNQLKANNINFIYEELKGKHEWSYWEKNIEKNDGVFC
jgi:enterochelin esterase-like enzyme